MMNLNNTEKDCSIFRRATLCDTWKFVFILLLFTFFSLTPSIVNALGNSEVLKSTPVITASQASSITDSDEPAIKTNTVVKMLSRGFAITLMVAFMSLLMGFLLAIPMGVILNNNQIRGYWLLRSFNDLVRGTPVLIQLFFVYFGLGALHFDIGSQAFSLNFSPITAAIVTLTINGSAYMAEVVRSGLMAVDKGQVQAAQALGFSNTKAFQFIIWPQAFRIAMPPLMNSVVSLLKDTALISVISVGEVIREAQSIISITFNPMKYYFIVAIMFFVVTYPLMKYAGRIEESIKKRGFISD